MLNVVEFQRLKFQETWMTYVEVLVDTRSRRIRIKQYKSATALRCVALRCVALRCVV